MILLILPPTNCSCGPVKWRDAVGGNSIEFTAKNSFLILHIQISLFFLYQNNMCNAFGRRLKPFKIFLLTIFLLT